MAVGLAEATLVATYLNTLLFGFFTAVFGFALHLLRQRHKRAGRSALAPIIVSSLMYTFSVAFFIASTVRCSTGFKSNSPEAYFFETASVLYVLRQTLLVAQTLLGDGFFIYRLKMISPTHVYIIVPACLTWLGQLAAGIGALHAVATASSLESVFELKNWITSFFVLTLSTNVYCTLSISIKLISAHRRLAILRSTSLASPTSLLGVAEVILESAAMYTATMVTLLATFLADSWSQYIFLDMVPHVIGIVFSIIFIRAHTVASLFTSTIGRSSNGTNPSSIGNLAARSLTLNGSRQAVTTTDTITERQDIDNYKLGEAGQVGRDVFAATTKKFAGSGRDSLGGDYYDDGRDGDELTSMPMGKIQIRVDREYTRNPEM